MSHMAERFYVIRDLGPRPDRLLVPDGHHLD
jgi:hypothetical protein